MPELSFKNWQVDLIRVTGFYGQIAPDKRKEWSSWWTQLVGVPPENSSHRKRDEVLQEEGPFNGGALILALQPGRIDWYLRALEDQEEGQQDIPASVVCLKPEAIIKFYELAVRWMKLDTCPPLTRLALGGLLLQPVEDRQNGYQKLKNYLHDVKLSPESSDFLYQINRPRDSRVGLSGLRINRLCKWSVALLGRISVSLSVVPKDKKPVTGSVEGQGQYACRVELDINTAQEFKGEFSGHILNSIFNELVDLAQEIAEKGDVP